MSSNQKIVIAMIIAVVAVGAIALVARSGDDEIVEPVIEDGAQVVDTTASTERARESVSEAVAAAVFEAGRQPRSFEIAATGDILIHSPIFHRARRNAADDDERDYDFRPMFRHVESIFEEADISICHLEAPLSGDNSRLTGYPLFSAPRELAADLADVHFDICSTASNHTIDRGMDGVHGTLDALDEAGVKHVGGNRNEREAMLPRIYDANGVTVGHIAATYSLNGLHRPYPWVVDLLADDRFKARATAARKAGAEFVIASIHWGYEYVAEPNREQRRIARELLEEGTVDLIIGHHAHVIQPHDEIAGRPVLYGLGNFLSNQTARCCGAGTQDGVIAKVEVIEDVDGGGWETNLSFVPTMVDRRDYAILDVGRELERAEEHSPYRRRTLEQSLARTTSVLNLNEMLVEAGE